MSVFHAGGSWLLVGTRLVLIPFFIPLARTIVLRLASLLVLLFSLWNQITCWGNSEAEDCKTCGYNYKEIPVRRPGGRDSWVLGGKQELGGSRLLVWEEGGAWLLEQPPLEDGSMDV